jgi:hypothetical protein
MKYTNENHEPEVDDFFPLELERLPKSENQFSDNGFEIKSKSKSKSKGDSNAKVSR